MIGAGPKIFVENRNCGHSCPASCLAKTVSRQAVSKFELNDAMPDTENILQISKLFGVSID
ncbi:MAG TPA: helix-turn-helix transcriptional regulator, partial [Clostridia bacterium]|nr:helix-turn-helix transcriptional regulator [Clostridia bacterium]